jgi:hypothetical protein
MSTKPCCHHVPCLFPISHREVMRRIGILDRAQPFRSLRIVRHQSLVQRACKCGEHIGVFTSHLREQSRREVVLLRVEDVHETYISVFGKGRKERQIGIHP